MHMRYANVNDEYRRWRNLSIPVQLNNNKTKLAYKCALCGGHSTTRFILFFFFFLHTRSVGQIMSESLRFSSQLHVYLCPKCATSNAFALVLNPAPLYRHGSKQDFNAEQRGKMKKNKKKTKSTALGVVSFAIIKEMLKFFLLLAMPLLFSHISYVCMIYAF